MAYSSKPTSLKEQGFYHTPAWRAKRKAILQRDHYLCKMRISEKCTRKANTVHHIKDLKLYPELALTDSNLISCCYWCHEETKARSDLPVGVRIIKI